MQRVVSDADVIIHLAKLNKLDLIRELYECAHIPRYVEFEDGLKHVQEWFTKNWELIKKNAEF